ncbi:MAG: helix-turn-helix domain-containing protein [Sedimentisphaeraceae bacterium JB056]
MQEEIYIRILNCKLVEIDDQWNYPNMLCTYWRLYINSSDGAILETDNKRHYLKKNTLYIIPAWQKVGLYNNLKIEHFYVHFDLIGVTGFLCKKTFPSLMEFGNIDRKEIISIIEQNYKDPLNKFIIDTRLKSLIYGLLFEYFKKISNEKRILLDRLIPATGKYSSLFEFIDNNLNGSIDNDSLARLSGKSPSHFLRDFTDSVGITPAKFVTQRRIARSIEMLILTDDTIDKIAYDTGFTDRFHFSKTFKKITGMPPAAYRKHSEGI